MEPSATILLVEDDPNDVFIMQRALKGAQIANPLQVATDGQEAFNYLAGLDKFADRARHPMPGLVFLDLKLPYKSGFELLQWVRGEASLRSIVVVILTSSSEQKDIEKARSLGMHSFLIKPPTKEVLVNLVESVK